MSGHCRHESCCQCGAKRGTPEHDARCLDAALGEAIAKHNANYKRKVRRRLPGRAIP